MIIRKNHPDWKITKDYLCEYGKTGLRTLVIGKRVISNKEFESWEANYKVLFNFLTILDLIYINESKEALLDTSEKKDELIEKRQDEIEIELSLVGATAIEDKLQVDVGKEKFEGFRG